MSSSGAAGVSPPPPPLPLRASYVNGYLASHAKKLENGIGPWRHDHHHHLYRVMPHPHPAEPTLAMTTFGQGHSHYHMGPSAASSMEKHLVGAHFGGPAAEALPQSQYSYGPPPPPPAPDTDHPHLQQQPTPNFIGANNPQVKKSSLKKRSRFDHSTPVGEGTKSEEHNHATGRLMGPNSSILGVHKRRSTAKHVELLNFTLKGGPPWGFRIKQRNGNVFISKVNCGGRGHKGGLRVHDEIISVNNFELDNHPLTLHRQPDSQSKLGFELDQLTKLDFTYQLIKHTLNRQLQLTVRRWHSDWDLAPHIFYPISSGDDEGPLHQSEEELLSPNEDLGPESRNAHRKLLTISHFQQQQQQQQQHEVFGKPTLLPTAPDAAHSLPHGLDSGGQFLIPPPANLGFGGSSVGGTDSVLSESSYTSGASSSTTTTGCLIAATAAEIQKAAEEVITTCSSSLTPTTTTTENSVYPSDYDHRCSSAKFVTRPEYSSSCSSAYCSAIHSNSNHHHQAQSSNGYFDDSSCTNDEYYEHHHQRHQDQTSDIAPLDLSPDGGSGSVESSLTEDPAKPPSQITEPSEDEEMTTVLMCGTNSFKTSGKSPKNIWSPCTSSSLASPSPTTSETISDLGPLGGKLSKSESSERQLGLNYLLYGAQQPPDSYPSASEWYQSEEQAYHQSHFPPPFSSATYAGFEHRAVSDVTSTPSIVSHSEVKPSQEDPLNAFSIERAFNLGRYPPTSNESLRAFSTLPRSMTIMAGQGAQEPLHHVAEVYEPRQHPVHKYWTLPRGIATGTGVATFATPETAEEEVDRFHQQLQEARIQEFAEQHLKSGDGVTETTTTVTKTAPEGSTTVSKQIVQHVVTELAPPPGATLLYETDDATFYTVPLTQTCDKEESGKQVSTTYAVPKKKIDGPISESEVSLTPKTAAKQEQGSEWYKTWVRNMHKMEGNTSATMVEDPANSISIKVKSPRYKGTDYHLSFDDHKTKYTPGNIADYEPGIRSSIFERERQLFYNDIFNYIDSIFAEVLASTAVSANQENGHHESSQQPAKQSSGQTAAKSSYYHENCVFNTLTGSVSGGSGYDSDSSYIIKKATKQAPKPASPSVYRAVQRGEMDIPLCGLQRPAPPRPNRTQQKIDSKSSSFEYAEDSGISVRHDKNDPDWDSLDEWQNQIENDFDYIYDTLRNVSTSSASTLRSGTHTLDFSRASSTPKASTPFPRRSKKSVAFDDEDEVQVIEVDEVDEPTLTNGDLDDEVEEELEEEEYSYAGLLRPGSHKPTGTARSFEHYLNTQDLNKSVQRLKSPEDKLRVRRHRRRSRSKSPVTNRTRSEERGSGLTNNYEVLDVSLPTYFESKSLSPVRMTTTATVVGKPEGKINVQYRMPTNPQLSDTNGDTSTSTATVMSSGRFYGGSYGSASQPQTPVSMKPIAKVTKMPCSEQTDRFSMQRHHYVPTPMSPVALDRYDRAFANKENEPKKVARVLYDFQAMGRNELAVKKSDLVVVRRSVNHNWVEVEDCSSGLVGFVPRTYLDYEQDGVARAKFDFQAKTSVEISFKKGEKLTLLRRVDNNWYEGINERQDVGIFPVSYVEPVKQPIVLDSSSTESRMSQSPAPSGSTTRSYLIHPSADSSSSVLATPPPSAGSSTGSMSLGPMASMPQLPTSSTPIQQLGGVHLPTGSRIPASVDPMIYFSSTSSEPAGGYSSSVHQIRRAPDASRQPGASVERFCLPKPRIYRVLYPYKPQQMDELELQYGDLLTVTIQCDDGWFLGRSTLTGKFGTFPGNYVEPV